jgi:hypothetical protein
MPPLTRWYIRSAMICLILGLVLGALHLVPGAPPWIGAAGPAAIHLIVVGWITQMIFGVAYWMFPKHTADRPRGPDGLAIATFVLINAGLALRVLAEPTHAVAPSRAMTALLVAAAATQALAGAGFVALTWPRVKEK